MGKENFIEDKIKEAQDRLCEAGVCMNMIQDYIKNKDFKKYKKAFKGIEWEKERLMDIFVDLYRLSCILTEE